MPGRARRVGQKRDLNEHEWLCQPLVFGFVIPMQFVIPAQSGIHTGELVSRLRGNDGQLRFQVLTRHERFLMRFHRSFQTFSLVQHTPGNV